MPSSNHLENKQSSSVGYDIIGDVHGCANTLVKLLKTMGYQKNDQGYYHPSRKTIFVGDIVDRGPRIREALHIVRDMCESQQAECVLGNHELYAITYFTLLNKGGHLRYLRPHTPHHDRLIAETLAQFEKHPKDWEMMLEWFKSLPLFIEKSGFRVVHACWDSALIADLKERFPSGHVDDQFIAETEDRHSFASAVFAQLTRGTSMHMPPGVVIKGRDGIDRSLFRTRFWSQNPKTYADVVFQPDPLPDYLINTPLSDAERARLVHYDTSEKPVFIGHYWLQGKPKSLRPNVACLDYSAVKYGKLVAYRFDGEQTLDDGKFCWVDVTREQSQ